MLSTSPLISWLAPAVSAAGLGLLWAMGDLRGWRGAALVGWFLAALTIQQFGGSTLTWALGLVFQTALAAYLVIRVRAGV